MIRLRLTRSNRIDGKAGDIVEVTPARAAFLLETKSAEPAEIREQIEKPETKAAAKRTTRKRT